MNQHNVNAAATEDDTRRRNGGTARLCARGHWRPHEDNKLKELVSKFGPQNWNLIAEQLQGRSGKSCRLRWFNQLNPRINRRAFSDDEEDRLLTAHRLYGNKWATIARLFPGRTDNAVKNHWHVIHARRNREITQNTILLGGRTRSKNAATDLDSHAHNACSESTISTNNPHTEMMLFPVSAFNDGGFSPESESNSGVCVEREKLKLRFIDFLGVGEEG